MRDRSFAEGCVHFSANERAHSKRDEEAQAPQRKPKRRCVSKNLNETVRLQSEKREERIRENRFERLQRTTESMISAIRLVSLSSVSFPGRIKCPGPMVA